MCQGARQAPCDLCRSKRLSSPCLIVSCPQPWRHKDPRQCCATRLACRGCFVRCLAATCSGDPTQSIICFLYGEKGFRVRAIEELVWMMLQDFPAIGLPNDCNLHRGRNLEDAEVPEVKLRVGHDYPVLFLGNCSSVRAGYVSEGCSPSCACWSVT